MNIKLNGRIIFGSALLLMGVLLLLEKLNILRGAGELFWGVIFLLGAAFFFSFFARNPRGGWWAIIPAMALLGMGGSAILPQAFRGLTGSLFLGGLGISFWVVYITDRSRWWGIIPGGVLVTLALISGLQDSERLGSFGSGSIFFLGLGITFLLVALLPNPSGKMTWAYIPAVVMILMGVVVGSASTRGLADYIWPAGLILAGLLVLYGFFFRKG